VILDRNRPIAEIVPVGSAAGRRTETDDGRLDALQREGLLRKGTGRIPPELVRGVGPGRGARVLDALLEERERGR
jgi:hypothetical protein